MVLKMRVPQSREQVIASGKGASAPSSILDNRHINLSIFRLNDFDFCYKEKQE